MSRFAVHLVVSLVGASLVAGCGAKAQESMTPGIVGLDDDSVAAILGSVVDEEFVPVANVTVLVTPGDLAATTDVAGAFRIAPLEPGSYVATFEKEGYGRVEQSVEVVDGQATRLAIVLDAIGLKVPYHESESISVHLDCFLAVQGLSTRCNPVDRVTGQNLTGDASRAFFDVPADNLVNMLFEATWQPTSATGRDIRVWWEPRGSAVALGGVTPQYMLVEGGPPLRAWMTPGEIGVNGNTPFDGNRSAAYTAQNRPSATNSTLVVGALYLEQRVDDWFTWFYNRAGPVEFTALPDT